MSARVLVVGACGRMGERVRAALAAEDALQLGAALEAPGHPELGRALEGGVAPTDDAARALQNADIAIVFATPAGTLAFLEAAATAGVPSVVGTTGFDAEERRRIEAVAARIPLLLAANFSVAVNVLLHLTRAAAARLGAEDYDAEISELHHAAKRDAPSGTALRLGEAIAEARGQDFARVRAAARAGETGARAHGSIGFAALRGGDNPGEHHVLFIGDGERLELTHRAQHRDHFARGALRAARWLLGKPPGLYNMEQVLERER